MTEAHLASDRLNGRHRYAAGEELAWLRGFATTLEPAMKVAIVGGSWGIVPLALLEGLRVRIQLQLVNQRPELEAAVAALKEAGRYAQADLSLVGPGEQFVVPLDVLIIDAETPIMVTAQVLDTPIVEGGLVYVRHFSYAQSSRAGKRLEVKDVVLAHLPRPPWKMTVRVAAAAGFRLYPTEATV